MSTSSFNVIRAESANSSFTDIGELTGVSIRAELGRPLQITLKLAPLSKSIPELYSKMTKTLAEQQKVGAPFVQLGTASIKFSDGQTLQVIGAISGIAPSVGSAGVDVTVTMSGLGGLTDLLNLAPYTNPSVTYVPQDPPDSLSKVPQAALKQYTTQRNANLAIGEFHRQLATTIIANNATPLIAVNNILAASDLTAWDAISETGNTPDLRYALLAFTEQLDLIARNNASGFAFLDTVAEAYGAVYVPALTGYGKLEMYATMRDKPSKVLDVQQIYPSVTRFGLRAPVRQVIAARGPRDISYAQFIGQTPPGIMAAYPGLAAVPESTSVPPPLWLSPSVVISSLTAPAAGYKTQTAETSAAHNSTSAEEGLRVYERLMQLWAKANFDKLFLAESTLQCVLGGINVACVPGDRAKITLAGKAVGVGIITAVSHEVSIRTTLDVDDATQGSARTLVEMSNVRFGGQ